MSCRRNRSLMLPNGAMGWSVVYDIDCGISWVSVSVSVSVSVFIQRRACYGIKCAVERVFICSRIIL